MVETALINDVQENVRCFNQEEAIWQRYREKRAERRRRFRLRSRVAKIFLDRLDWIAAVREMRQSGGGIGRRGAVISAYQARSGKT
jgi:hypothetical protein